MNLQVYTVHNMWFSANYFAATLFIILKFTCMYSDIQGYLQNAQTTFCDGRKRSGYITDKKVNHVFH